MEKLTDSFKRLHLSRHPDQYCVALRKNFHTDDAFHCCFTTYLSATKGKRYCPSEIKLDYIIYHVFLLFYYAGLNYCSTAFKTSDNKIYQKFFAYVKC